MQKLNKAALKRMKFLALSCVCLSTAAVFTYFYFDMESVIVIGILELVFLR